MTDTPAESAEDPRTPDPLLSVTAYAAAIRAGDDAEAILRVAIHYAVRAALAARDAEWREAVRKSQHGITHYEGCPCADLRALLSEGKPGK